MQEAVDSSCLFVSAGAVMQAESRYGCLATACRLIVGCHDIRQEKKIFK